MKSHHIKAPTRVYPLLNFTDFQLINKLPRVFLAGSIDMGLAEFWQDKVVDAIPENVVFYNPRRDDWDSSWKQSINDPQFNEQVTWEMDGLDRADIIFLYFSPTSKAPISLLELGLYANSGKLIVCCPDEFWRKGNVEMVCHRFNIRLFNTFDTAIEELKRRIQQDAIH